MAEKLTYEELEKRIRELEQSESEHKRIRGALKESQDRFQLLYEKAPLPYQSLDKNGNFIEVNPSWLDVTGYSREEVIGKPFGDFLHPDWKTHFKENFPRFKAVGEILGVEFEMIKKDGSLILVSLHGKIGKDKRGNVQQTHCIFQDITERKQAEKALKKSEKELKSIFRATPAGIGTVCDRVIKQVTDRLCEMTGYSRKELIGQNARILYPTDEDYEYVGKEKYRQIRERGIGTVETRFKRKDGKIIYVLMSSAPIDRKNLSAGVTFISFDITANKQMEVELRKNQNFLKKAQEIGQIGTWDLDIKKNKLFWTDENYRIFGLPIGTELTYEIFLNCVHPDDREYVDTEWKASFHKKPYDIEHRLIVDGKVKWVREKAEFEFNEMDECIRGTGFTQDITERKQAEASLQRYAYNLGERVKELNCLYNISKLIDRTDISFDEIFQGIVDLIPPGLQYPENACSRIVIAEQEYKTANYKTTKWNQKSDIFVYGERIGVLEVCYLEAKPNIDDGPFLKEERDLICAITRRLGHIVERKQNERNTQALVESTVGMIGQELFDNIVARLCEWLESDCAIIGKFSRDGSVTAVSMVLDGEPVNNYSYHLKGNPCNETVRKCYCGYPENVCALCPDDPDLIEMDADGYVGVSLEDRKGKPIGILCAISRGKLHLTKQTENVMKIIGARVSAEIERIKIEKEKDEMAIQLRQSQKMEAIGTLAGGIAHDFNNILVPIMGYAELLLGDIPEDSPSRNGLNAIYSSALRASDLVRQILTFSRQKSGELTLMKMQPIVKEALKLIRSTIPATIEIRQNIQTDCGIIKADPTQIHQIIMNLATNAYHAMGDSGGELNVSLKEIELGQYDLIRLDITPGVYACLTIADTGVGMDKDLTYKIFDPFFTTKKKGKGTGMGLSVVHGIVKSLGGAIHVYSEPGKGAEFKVYLPMEKSSIKKQNIQDKGSIQGGTERILHVDDEEGIVTMGKMMLERLGYQITSSTSSIEALKAFRANPDKFDMVITDLAMPNMPGDKLLLELVKIRPDIPVLLCTGFSETMSEERAILSGFKGFLLKPILIKELSRKIREVLGENNN